MTSHYIQVVLLFSACKNIYFIVIKEEYEEKKYKHKQTKKNDTVTIGINDKIADNSTLEPFSKINIAKDQVTLRAQKRRRKHEMGNCQNVMPTIIETDLTDERK